MTTVNAGVPRLHDIIEQLKAQRKELTELCQSMAAEISQANKEIIKAAAQMAALEYVMKTHLVGEDFSIRLSKDDPLFDSNPSKYLHIGTLAHIQGRISLIKSLIETSAADEENNLSFVMPALTELPSDATERVESYALKKATDYITRGVSDKLTITDASLAPN